MKESIFVRSGFSCLISTATLSCMLMLTSCTRPVEHNTGIKLVLPSNMAQKALAVGPYLEHLVINVSGTGITTPVFYSWDSDGGRKMPPATFEMMVPGGNGRLVQVLAIYGDQGVSDELFYGDSTISINSDMSVEIFVSNMNTNNVPGEGQIFGRYLAADGSGPTGQVTMKYNPPNGKPTMVVHSSEIFGGYFRLFALKGVAFDYILPNGTSLFGQPITADYNDGTSSAILDTSATARFSMPMHYRSEGENQFGVPVYRSEIDSDIIVGFFGPGASTQSVCYPDSALNLNIHNTYVDSQGLTELVWGLDADVVAGGSVQTLDGSNLCSPGSGSRYVNFMSLDAENLGNHDMAAGFRGPYVMKQNGSTQREAMSISFVSSLNINYEYLPGVHTNGTYKGVDGSDVFYRVLTAAENFNEESLRVDDGIACGALPGFALLGGTSSAGGGMKSFSVSMGSLPAGLQTAYSEGRAMFALCPYQLTSTGTKYYFKSGELYRNYSNGGGGGGSLNYKLKIVGWNGTTVVPPSQSWAYGACSLTKGYKVQLVDSAGNPAINNSGSDLNILLDVPSMSVPYTEVVNACGGTVVSGVTIMDGSGISEEFYVQGGNDEYTYIEAMFDLNSMLQGYLEVTAGINSTAPDSLMIQGPPYLAVGACYPVSFAIMNAGSYPAYYASGGATAITPSLTGGLTGSFYATSTCTGAASTSFTLTQGNDRVFAYFKPSNIGSGGMQIVASGNNAGIGSTPASFPISVGPNTLSSFSVSPMSLAGFGFFHVNECMPVGVGLLNNVGANVILSTSTSGTLTVVGGSSVGNLYSNEQDCLGNVNGSSSRTFTVNSGSQGAMMWLQIFTTPDTTISASGTGAASGVTGSTLISYTP